MKKILITLALVFAIALSGVFIAKPVEAQEPMESCTLVRDIEYNDTTFSADEANGYGEDKDFGVAGGADEGEVEVGHGDGAGAYLCMINIVNRIAQMAFYAMMAIVILLVIVGGYFILTAGGAEDNIKKGKNYITYAIVGVVIAMFAWAVPALISFMV